MAEPMNQHKQLAMGKKQSASQQGERPGYAKGGKVGYAKGGKAAPKPTKGSCGY